MRGQHNYTCAVARGYHCCLTTFTFPPATEAGDGEVVYVEGIREAASWGVRGAVLGVGEVLAERIGVGGRNCWTPVGLCIG